MILQGPFGTVYSNMDCAYNSAALASSSYRDSSTAVRAYDSDAEHDDAIATADPPSGMSSQITNVSLIRIVPGGPQYLVVTATYWPRGRMTGHAVDPAKDGKWLPTTSFDLSSNQLEEFGLPAALNVDEVARTGRAPFENPRGRASERDVVNVHYAYDRWIRQDDSVAGGNPQRRYLTYLEMPEDALLVPRCAERMPKD